MDLTDPGQSFEAFVNAYFESMSGFTTTGATVLEMPESSRSGYYPNEYGYSLILWRAETQWLGGMGIIVLSVVFLSRILSGSILLLRAEGTSTEMRLRPKISETFAILRWIYIGITIIQILLLKMAGMRWYDSICHSFTVIASGGFSPMYGSIAAYPDPAIQFLLATFMIMAGINFVLYYHMMTGKPSKLFRDPEFRAYASIMSMGVLLIILNLVYSGGMSLGKAFNQGAFNGISIMTTTGYASADFNTWPDAARLILILFMFIGGSAGSTAGAIKVVRIVILFKTFKREIIRLLHPKAIVPVRLGGKQVPDEMISGLTTFFFIYIIIAIVSTLALTFIQPSVTMGGEEVEWDIVSSVSAVATTMGGVGPGLNVIGPTNSFLALAVPTKIWLCVCMWFGRLEIYAALILFFPSTYKA
jgi:trk system potassium uptake protein TrkH